MYKKAKLFISIKQFYNTFSEVIGENPCAQWSRMTDDNIMSVLFDIGEALEAYDDTDEWLNKLYAQITEFRYTPLTLNTVLFNICHMQVNGFYEARPYTTPVRRFAEWLYKKGVI